MNSPTHSLEVIKLRTYKGDLIVNTTNIIRLEGHCNYTVFIINGGRKLLTSKTISYYESLLPTQFLRVHKRCIINTEFLTTGDITHLSCLQLSDGFAIPVSRRRKKLVKHFIINKKIEKNPCR